MVEDQFEWVTFSNLCEAGCGVGYEEYYQGECVVTVYGCTDPAADNYYADANANDGSCVFLNNSLSLQGVMDLSIPSSGGKEAIHLIALSEGLIINHGIGIAVNGQGSNEPNFYLDTFFVNTGDDILLANNPGAMNNYFGECMGEFEHVFDVSLSINGDDAVVLYEQGLAVEIFGDINVDGTGQEWEYLDSWAYKVGDLWFYGGVNCTDGSQTSATSDCPYPICSDTPIEI